MTDVKICGVTTPEIITVLNAISVDFVGFVFVQQSPRFVSLDKASALSQQVTQRIKKVGLFVDPDDNLLQSTLQRVSLDCIQLHGNETPARVQELKSRFSLPIIKAISIASPADLASIPAYESVADWLLLDSKPPANSAITGGNGISFDWNILKNYKFQKPWMLSGGLTSDNIGEALSLLKPHAVDVSSGVERSRGIKDAQKIKDFVQTVRS